jgi:MFS family permease
MGAGGVGAAAETPPGEGALTVFRNPSFLRLWLSQAATQIGGNMVLFGLTVVVSVNNSNTAVSLLILSFLAPAVLVSAVAGVYVDRVDRRLVLIATNVLRGLAIIGLFLVGDHLLLLLLLNLFVSTVTVFFAPAEAAMIPEVVPRSQLLAANGVFTLTLNAAFALGFALLGPLVINIAGPQAVILVVAALYFLAAVFCFTLPPSPPPARLTNGDGAVLETQHAVASTIGQLREGFSFIRGHRSIGWSLLYLGITASLVGVLGVLGPDFAQTALGLQPKDTSIIVLPLGAGIVMGILLLNSYGQFLPRRRVIEGGLIVLGVMLALLSVAGPISQFLQRVDEAGSLLDLSAITSLLAIVVFIAFIAGIAYAAVAIPSQTQLQEDLPEDVRGRVFGVLNMLVSVSSFLPIIIVGPISDLIGTATVMLLVAVGVLASGIASVFLRDPNLGVAGASADPHVEDPIAAALGADRPTWREQRAAAEAAANPVAPNPVASNPAAPPPASVPGPAADPLGIAGPSDPADRD